MAYVDLISSVHRATKRDYVERVVKYDKATCAAVAKRFGQDYWDGERQHGYGGYRYDGRWRPVAEAMVKHYGLEPDARILDVGCGKGYLLHEFTRVLPRASVTGLDISRYGLKNGKEELGGRLVEGTAASVPFPDDTFDFVVSLGALHNLRIQQLWTALQEMERVGRGPKYLSVESWRNEREKANLLYWQLTCEAFFDPDEWAWLFRQTGYSGDWGFMFFE